MTVIVALKEGDRIYFGADSCVGGTHESIIGRPKIFKRGEFLFGASGYLRSLQLLAYSVTFPPIMTGQDHYHYLINSVIPCIKRGFAQHGNLEIVDEIESLNNSAFLIAFRGNIYTVSPDAAIDEWVEGYGAIGSGSKYALGSFCSTEGRPAEERVRMALEAASKFGEGVCPPFEIISLEWDGYEDQDIYRYYDSDGSVKEYVLEDAEDEVEINSKSSRIVDKILGRED